MVSFFKQGIAANTASAEHFIKSREILWKDEMRQIFTLHELQYNETARHVILTAGNIAYAAAYRNWDRMTNVMTNTVRVVIGMDDETCALVRRMRIAHLCMGNNDFSMNQAVAIVKFLGPLVCLRENLSVIFSELDVFWFRSPLPFLESRPSYDVQVSGHVQLGPPVVDELRELNDGFFYVRPSPAGLHLFEELVSYFILHTLEAHKRTWDQKALDFFVRREMPPGETASLVGERDTWGNLFLDVSPLEYQLNWARLPGALFVHNWENVFTINFEKTITLHISWNIHQPWERLQAAWEFGLAPLVEPKPGGYWGTNSKVINTWS